MSVLVFAALGKKPEVPYFEEITVERINVVEPDGRRKLVIASSARQTEGTIGGVEVPIERTRPAGMIYFNNYGDEIGGFTFGGDRTSGVQSLTFDQAGQDQVFQLINREWTEEDGRLMRSTGVHIVDRPTDRTILDDVLLLKKLDEVEDPEERKRIIEKLSEGVASRLYIGRTASGEAGLFLSDGNGRTRLRLVVEEGGAARIEFLDTEGNVVRTIGPDLM